MANELENYKTFVEKNLSREKLGSNYQIHSLAGDASNRRYFRVVSDNDSWVLMVWEPFVDDGRYPFLNVLTHFANHNIQVPKIIAKSPQEGLVLLEDLGDLTLERKFWENQNQEMSIPYYQLALDELIKIHYDASFDKNDCVAFKIAFDTEKLLWEMNYGKDHLLLKMSQLKLSEKTLKDINSIFTKICETLNQEPKYIAHRDYHSRNVMIKLGKMRVIDFQDARMGAIQYDLVSLLRDSYVQIQPDIEKKLLQYYLEKRQEKASKFQLPFVSQEHFELIYEIQSIQRCFKACGSFASFYNLRQDTRYLKYLEPTLVRVKNSLEKFKEYKLFYDVLNDHGLFEQKFT